jgi:hypothetical protein
MTHHNQTNELTTCFLILPPHHPEHHTIKARPAVIISFYRRPTPIAPPHSDINDDELADTPQLSKQVIVM